MTYPRFNANESIKININNPPKNESPMQSRYYYKGRLLDEFYRDRLEDFLPIGFERFLRQNPPLNPQCWLNIFPDGRISVSHNNESHSVNKAIGIPLNMRLSPEEREKYPIDYSRCKLELQILVEEAVLRLK